MTNLQTLQERYAFLSVEEKKLTKEKDALKEEIETLLADTREPVETEFGTFVMVPYTSWTYSDVLKSIEVELKIQKVNEQEQGIATAKVTHNLRFTAPKK